MFRLVPNLLALLSELPYTFSRSMPGVQLSAEVTEAHLSGLAPSEIM